jgi:hypothetical protein
MPSRPPDLASVLSQLPYLQVSRPLRLNACMTSRPPDLFHEHNQVGREEKLRYSDGREIAGISRMVIRVDNE